VSNKLLTNASKHTGLKPFGEVDGLCLAQHVPFDYIRMFHEDVERNYDQIESEIEKLLDASDYESTSMLDFDPMQKAAFGEGPARGWKPAFVKLGSTYASIASRIPCLSKIAQTHSSKLVTLFISVLEPGAQLSPHRGPNAGVLRYHLGITIPQGDVGLQIYQHSYKWKEQEGIVWDDVQPHAAWNRTNQRRIVLFADFLRPFPWWLQMFNKCVICILERTRHIRNMQAKLQQHGIQKD
jgi:aspartyl/asparaginyl beta-hydroxylase (cupin superfamily)